MAEAGASEADADMRGIIVMSDMPDGESGAESRPESSANTCEDDGIAPSPPIDESGSPPTTPHEEAADGVLAAEQGAQAVEGAQHVKGARQHVFDEYGFLVSASIDESSDFRSHNYNPLRLQLPPSALEEWGSVISNWDVMSQFQPDKIAELLKGGVPSELRSTVWSLLLDVAGIKATLKLDYDSSQASIKSIIDTRRVKQEQLEERRRLWAAQAKDGGCDILGDPPTSILEEDGLLPSIKAVNQIYLDLDRTFYTHQHFKEKMGEGQQKLFRILALYARVNPHTGYCQGMAYVAASLLMVMEEEHAFWALAALLERGKYLQNYYAEDLTHVQRDARLFQEMLRLRHPPLSAHLSDLDIHPLMYITQWFMCLFTALPLWDTTLAVWDLFFFSGRRTLYCTALAIMDTCQDDLLATASMGELLPYLQHLPESKLNTSTFVPALWSVTPREVDELLHMAEENLRTADAEIAALNSVRKARRPVDQAEPSTIRRVRPSAPPEAPPTLLRRMFGSLTTPLRVLRDPPTKQLPPRTETPPRYQMHVCDTLPETLSPSFSRSGVLSPSFRGSVRTLLSPCPVSHLDLTMADSLSIISTSSPTQAQSFDAFKLRTPLRPTQAQTPATAKTTKRPDPPLSVRPPLGPLVESPDAIKLEMKSMGTTGSMATASSTTRSALA